MNVLPLTGIIAATGKDYLLATANESGGANPRPPREARLRRKTMKTMMLAAAAVLTLGIGECQASCRS